MNIAIAVGLALITAFGVLLVAMKPSAIGTWLGFFAIVAVLGLMAVGEHRRRNGRSLWSGVPPRVAAYSNVALGVIFTAAGAILLANEAYLNGAFTLLCGVVTLGAGVFWVMVLPNSTLERDASKNGSRPSP